MIKIPFISLLAFLAVISAGAAFPIPQPVKVPEIATILRQELPRKLEKAEAPSPAIRQLERQLAVYARIAASA